MRKFMAMLALVFVWTSCTDDAEIPAGLDVINTENVLVKLDIIVPASVGYVHTKEVLKSVERESVISEIQVLVFENGGYAYRVPGLFIGSAGSVVSFTALLKSSSAPLRLLFVANSTDAVSAGKLAVGDGVDVIKKKINMVFDAGFLYLPMYGECELPVGLSAGEINKISGIKMLRSVARVDVEVAEAVDFKLTGVKAYRANDHLQVIPDELKTVRVSAPSVPQGSAGEVNSAMFSVLPEDQNRFSAQLYLPESDSPVAADRVNKATCIVVEGYYADSDTPSYYRMDFDSGNDKGAFGQILRNHKYIFNIRKVSAPGWSTPDDAANNRSSSITAEVQSWDDYTIGMYFDGEHHFGVSARELVLRNRAGDKRTISVDTDLAGYTLQWADAAGTPSGPESQSLANEYFTVEKTQDGTQLVVTALQGNTADHTLRTQYFLITAARWHILVTIQQKYDVAAYQTIDLLTFNTGLGYLGTNLIGSSSAEARATGLRGILTNQKNFGPDGTVECGGYNLIGVGVNNNKLTDALFASVDVVYVHYMSNGSFGNLDARKAHDWLKARKNRVLIASYDASDVSRYLLEELLGGTADLNYLTKNNGPYPLATPEEGNRYFTIDGPFTSGENTPVTSGFSLRNYDAYHGEIRMNTAAAEGITPILLGPEGGIVLGIDYSRRIVYWGDTDIGNSAAGTGATGDNHINNNDGNINNNASKLIANVFAWITETVLYGE